MLQTPRANMLVCAGCVGSAMGAAAWAARTVGIAVVLVVVVVIVVVVGCCCDCYDCD